MIDAGTLSEEFGTSWESFSGMYNDWGDLDFRIFHDLIPLPDGRTIAAASVYDDVPVCAWDGESSV